MTTVEGIVGAIIAGMVGIFFWLFKRGHTRIDDLDRRLRHAVTEQEVRIIVDDKLAPLKAQNTDLGRRLSRLEAKIDKLIEIAVNK